MKSKVGQKEQHQQIHRPQKRGRLVVIEGTDGSGKGTQIRPITQIFQSLDIPFELVDFPQYESNEWGAKVGKFLKGEYGSLNEIDPRVAAIPYMLDRLQVRDQIKSWLKEGKVVLANRYATSNLAFQSARVENVKEQEELLNWLKKVEYEIIENPKEDLVVLLNVTPQISQKNVDKKEARGYLKGEKTRDIYEEDLPFQARVAKTYLKLAKREMHWRVVNCMEGENLKSPGAITREILKVLMMEGVI